MGLLDAFKNIMNVPDEDEYDDDFDEQEESAPKKREREETTSAPKKQEASPRVFQGGKSKTISYAQAQSSLQVVLVKPERFEDVTAIADHLNEKKTVVLNLEVADRDTSRRIIDFLSGVAYANHGNMRKVANATFIIVPTDVDVMGELTMDDFDESKLYF